MTSISNDYYVAQMLGRDFTRGITDKTGDSSNEKNTDKSANKTDSQKKQQSFYGNSTANALSSLVSETLAGMGLSAGDSVSFRTIMEYRDKLGKEFESKVKADLKELGVDENVKFQVVSNKDGGVSIISDSPDKAKIEKYFADNPDMVKAFNKIQSLTNVEEARKSQNVDVAATRQRIQVESMTAWFTNTGKGVSSIMDFTGGTSSLMAGLNKVV